MGKNKQKMKVVDYFLEIFKIKNTSVRLCACKGRLMAASSSRSQLYCNSAWLRFLLKKPSGKDLPLADCLMTTPTATLLASIGWETTMLCPMGRRP